MSPFTRTALPELSYLEAVRRHHEIEVPVLALPAAILAVSQSQFLLAVPVKGFRPRSLLPVHLDDSVRLPLSFVRQKNLDRIGPALPVPQYQYPHGVVHFPHANALGEIPLPAFLRGQGFRSSGGMHAATVEAFSSSPLNHTWRLNFKSAT
jgi:hypothetical protein